MQVKAVGKYIRVQPRKVRIIADEVRLKSALYTAAILRHHTSKSAAELRKVLLSAMANAQENHGINPESLRIAAITVDEGPRLKRMQARAMGRGYRIVKKTSHITVVVEEDDAINETVKAHGTKPKPRPTFAVKKGKARAAKAEEPVAEAAPVVEEEAPVTEEVTEAPTAAPEAAAPEAPEAAGDEKGEE